MKWIIKNDIRDIRRIRVTEWIITILFILGVVVLILLIGVAIGGAIVTKTGDSGVFENAIQLLVLICISLFGISFSLMKDTKPEFPPYIFKIPKEGQEMKQE